MLRLDNPFFKTFCNVNALYACQTSAIVNISTINDDNNQKIATTMKCSKKTIENINTMYSLDGNGNQNVLFASFLDALISMMKMVKSQITLIQLDEPEIERIFNEVCKMDITKTDIDLLIKRMRRLRKNICTQNNLILWIYSLLMDIAVDFQQLNQIDDLNIVFETIQILMGSTINFKNYHTNF